MADNSRASVVASGFLTLLASQIGTRLVTFTINLLIARHLSPEAYGAAGGSVDSVSVLRVALLVLPVGAVVTAGVCGVALWRHGAAGGGGAAEGAVPYYREAVLLHGIAALLELLAEPFYILTSVHLMFG
ncbi:hypothetical protein GPECTOR_18g52 [Gonium pectorale]|uniref:Protein RFT1 homolog n=1 Tax=Gonium pectorale TaxID=33097 RepID=A0A150GJY6_GONPE|nr:hypothetical protein GPECTOR_18g52 [Gonium pectorale]|eukprot:KXZ50074.1 hypothetical protein GPECTOR_18g52 [Gonium pectorale]